MAIRTDTANPSPVVQMASPATGRSAAVGVRSDRARVDGTDGEGPLVANNPGSLTEYVQPVRTNATSMLVASRILAAMTEILVSSPEIGTASRRSA
jgi:hypothetical protein